MWGVKGRIPEVVKPLLLPEAGEWREGEDVLAYARECMAICGLEGWVVKWDRAARRLGCCKMTRREISLSRHFVQHYLSQDAALIRSTVLHELAHALAWVHHGDKGHGPAWRYWCAVLGIPEERAQCKCEDFRPSHMARRPRYALCNRETGEVYRYYYRMPKRVGHRLASCYIPGKKEETLGKLCVVLVENSAM